MTGLPGTGVGSMPDLSPHTLLPPELSKQSRLCSQERAVGQLPAAAPEEAPRPTATVRTAASWRSSLRRPERLTHGFTLTLHLQESKA